MNEWWKGHSSLRFFPITIIAICLLLPLFFFSLHNQCFIPLLQQTFQRDEETGTIIAQLPDRTYATGVKIVLETTEDSPAEFIVDVMKVFGCFKREVTTTSTTPAETTTQKTTTTFTPTSTTVTTVQVSTRPTTPQISK